MELTFLGTGTSQGIPMIGCDCAVCRSTDPRDRRTRSSLHIRTAESSWVIDTGADFRAQCLREGLSWLDAVLYTHSHSDHVLGFDDLRRFCDFLAGPIPIHASRETLEALARIYPFAFEGPPIRGYVQPDPRVVEGPFWLGRTEVHPLEIAHGSVHTFGYLFRRNDHDLLGYFSDCKELSDPVIERLRGVKLLVIDALRHRSHPTHMNLEEALAVAEKIAPEQALFTHLCHDLGHAETEAALPPGVGIAYDGLRVRLEAGVHTRESV